jgi:hypothetical protein
MLCGCDGVFGLHELHVPPSPDVMSDATPSNFEIVNKAYSHSNGPGTALTYPLMVPDGTDRMLVMFVALGSDCPPGNPYLADITMFRYAGMSATRVDRLQGTPCYPNASSSEVWVLPNPPVGSSDVVLSISTSVKSIHSSALVLTGVDQTNPSRGCGKQSQTGDTSVISLASDPNDLVVSYIAQGKGITGPGSNATLVYLDNVNDFTTLNNSAASTLPGSDTDVVTTWSFVGTDEWEAIACSLRRAR